MFDKEEKTESHVEEFERHIILYEKLMYNIAYRMMGNEEDAKDCTQEACIKMYKQFLKLRDKSAIKAWACKITTNVCIDAMRKQSKRTTILMDADQFAQLKSNDMTPEEAVLYQESIREIQQALDKLKLEYKTLIILRDINGLAYDEIGFAMGLKLGTVKSRLSRARKIMSKLLLEKRNKEKNKSSLLDEGGERL